MASPIDPRARVHRGRDLGLTFVLFIFALIALILIMPRDLEIYDEGIILSSALRVLDGQVVHRDFYSTYGPGQYYVLAGIFQISDDDFAAARLYDLIVRAAIVAVSFFILLRRAPLFWSLAGASAIFLWAVCSGTYIYPVFPGILLSLVGAYLLVNVAGRPGFSAPTFVAGMCAGLTALFRYDVGFFVAAANLMAAGSLIFAQATAQGRLRRALQMLVAYGAGTSLVFLPAAGWFLLNAPLQAFYGDIVEFSLKYYAPMRALPFPDFRLLAEQPSQIAIYVPPIAVVLVALRLLARARQSRTEAGTAEPIDTTAYLVIFGILTAFCFLKGVVRVSTVQMLLSLVPASMVCALLAAQAWRRGLVAKGAAVALVLLAAGPPLLLSAHEIAKSVKDRDRSVAGWLALQGGLMAPASGAAKCETAPGSGIARLAPDYARAANYIAWHSRPNERILAALDRHDKVFINPTSLYFASGRLPGTHWHQFDPGLQTRADVQTAMIAELRRNDVRWVVRDASFSDVVEPNGSARSSGVRLLDRYLDQHYRPAVSYGKVSIWLRDGEVITPATLPSGCA